MAIKIIVSLLLTLFSFTGEQSKGQTGVIKLECVGDSDKPYYTIIFHLPGTPLDTANSNMFTIVLEISIGEYNDIKKTLSSKSLNGETATLNCTYKIWIKDTHYEKVFTIRYLEPLNDIFKGICQDIDKISMQTILKSVFSQTLYRLGSKIGLE